MKNRIVQQKAPNTWDVSYFPITNDVLNTIGQRYIRKPMDCVINAMQAVGIVDSRSADIMRIFVGDRGIQESEIMSMFEYIFKRRFRFSVFDSSNYQMLFNILNNDTIIPRSTAIFAGLLLNNGNKHMIIIGKTVDGELIYIDAQNPLLCNLNNGSCMNAVLGNTLQVSIIEGMTDQTLVVNPPLEVQAVEPMTDI